MWNTEKGMTATLCPPPPASSRGAASSQEKKSCRFEGWVKNWREQGLSRGVFEGGIRSQLLQGDSTNVACALLNGMDCITSHKDADGEPVYWMLPGNMVLDRQTLLHAIKSDGHLAGLEDNFQDCMKNLIDFSHRKEYLGRLLEWCCKKDAGLLENEDGNWDCGGNESGGCTDDFADSEIDRELPGIGTEICVLEEGETSNENRMDAICDELIRRLYRVIDGVLMDRDQAMDTCIIAPRGWQTRMDMDGYRLFSPDLGLEMRQATRNSKTHAHLMREFFYKHLPSPVTDLSGNDFKALSYCGLSVNTTWDEDIVRCLVEIQLAGRAYERFLPSFGLGEKFLSSIEPANDSMRGVASLLEGWGFGGKHPLCSHEVYLSLIDAQKAIIGRLLFIRRALHAASGYIKRLVSKMDWERYHVYPLEAGVYGHILETADKNRMPENDRICELTVKTDSGAAPEHVEQEDEMPFFMTDKGRHLPNDIVKWQGQCTTAMTQEERKLSQKRLRKLFACMSGMGMDSLFNLHEEFYCDKCAMSEKKWFRYSRDSDMYWHGGGWRREAVDKTPDFIFHALMIWQRAFTMNNISVQANSEYNESGDKDKRTTVIGERQANFMMYSNAFNDGSYVNPGHLMAWYLLKGMSPEQAARQTEKDIEHVGRLFRACETVARALSALSEDRKHAMRIRSMMTDACTAM